MQTINEVYRNLRRDNIRRTASDALRRAREFVAAGKSYYAKTPGTYNPEFQQDGRGAYRWIENASDVLRLVGFADEIAPRRVDHKGWYADAHGSSVYRGVVYQMPGRDGKARYVPGYADPDNEGCALLSFADVITGEPGGNGDRWSENDYDARRDAAGRADGIAQSFAEDAKEYDTAWQAGRYWSDIGEDAKQLRTELRAVVRDAKAMTATLAPSLCDTLRTAIRGKLAELEQLRTKRACLANGDGHGRDGEYGFWTGSKILRDAFNEGAQVRVLA